MEDDVLAVLDQVGRGRAKTNHLGGGGGGVQDNFFPTKRRG